MTLGQLLQQLQTIASQIKDRDPLTVDVVVQNPHAPMMCRVIEYRYTLAVEAYERIPDPVDDKNRPVVEWHKQIRIILPV